MKPCLALLLGSSPVFEIVIIPLFVAWIWAMIDCVITPKMWRTEKIVWFLALVVLNVLAAIAYWAARFVAKRKGFAASGGS